MCGIDPDLRAAPIHGSTFTSGKLTKTIDEKLAIIVIGVGLCYYSNLEYRDFRIEDLAARELSSPPLYASPRAFHLDTDNESTASERIPSSGTAA